MNKKYSKYSGTFICQRCSAKVLSGRFWRDTYDFTWMCNDNHVSKVNLYGKGY